jgi:hypothetical protein
MSSIIVKAGSGSKSTGINRGKSLIGSSLESSLVRTQTLTISENVEIKEALRVGGLGGSSSGGTTEDAEIDDSQIIGSKIDNTIIGGTTASSARFTNVQILNATPAANSASGALIVSGGIGVAGRSYFGEQLHADEFHGCGRNITSILGENVIGNVSAEPNYLIIKVGQHCVDPPNIAANINAVGIGSGHYLFGYNSLIVGGKKSNNYSNLSGIMAGQDHTINYGGNHSIILGGKANYVAGTNSAIISSIESNVIGGSSVIIGANNSFISGSRSIAIGSNISISHSGCTLISDNQPAFLISDSNNQFKVRALGGTTLNSTLVVSDSTTLNSTLSVIGASALTGDVSISSVTESSTTGTGALTISGGVGISKDVNVGDDLSLLSDNSILNFGLDRDVNLTHIPDTGLRLNDSKQLQFRDSTVHVSSDADGFLNLQADTGVNINVNGTDEILVTNNESTFSGNINIPNSGFIGTLGDPDALSISSTGVLSLSSTLNSTSSSTGALIVSGGVGIGSDISIGSNINLKSDNSVLNFGDDSDVNLTHVPDTAIRLNDSKQLQFRDSAIHISSDADGFLNLQADAGVNLNVNGTDEILITNNESTFGGNIIIPNSGLIGSTDYSNSIAISNTGVINITSDVESTNANIGVLVVKGGVGISKKLNVDGISTFNKELICNNTLTGNFNLRVGSNHTCSINTSSILGASNSNISNGSYSAIVNGENHLLTSNNSVIINGKRNINQGDFSVCSGFGSKTEKLGQISHAMGFFGREGDSQSSNFIFRRTITHVSGTEYKIGINNIVPHTSNDASLIIDNNSLFSYNVNINGIATTNNKFWNFILKGVVHRNNSGTYTHIKGTKEIIVKNKLSDDANINVDSTYGIYLVIKIASTLNVQWVATLQAVENKLN